VTVLATGLVLSPAVLALVGVGVSLLTDLLDNPKSELGETAKVVLLILVSFGTVVLVEATGQSGGVNFDRQFWNRFVVVLAAAFLSHYGITVPTGISKAIQDHLSIPALSSAVTALTKAVSPTVVEDRGQVPHEMPRDATGDVVATKTPEAIPIVSTANAAPATVVLAPTTYASPPTVEASAETVPAPSEPSDPSAAAALSPTIDVSTIPPLATEGEPDA
jgi:hypothetical protein